MVMALGSGGVGRGAVSASCRPTNVSLSNVPLGVNSVRSYMVLLRDKGSKIHINNGAFKSPKKS